MRCGATPEVKREESIQTTFESCSDSPTLLEQVVQNLAVHHLFAEDEVPNEQDPHHPTNLVTLCARCHKKLEPRNLGKQLSACDIDDVEDLERLELEGELRRQVRREIRRLSEKPETEIGELPSPTLEFLYGLTDQTQLNDFLNEGIQQEFEYNSSTPKSQREQVTFSAF